MLPSTRPAAAFTERQLKQFRAQCLVFLAFRNQQEPKKLHLEIALGGCIPAAPAGGRRAADGDGRDGETSSSRSEESSSASGLPLPPHLLPVSSLRLSSSPVVTEEESHHHHHDEDRAGAAVHDE